MINNILRFVILLLCFTALACGNGKRNIKEFYLPVEKLTKGLVYEYRPVKDEALPVDYWYYSTHERDSGLFLVGQYYDQHFNVMQLSTEEVVSNGSLIHNYRIYQVDTTGQKGSIDAEINYANAFPFEVMDSTTIFLMEMKFVSQKEPEISTTLVRNRRYKGDATYNYKGKELPCIEFSVLEKLEHVDQTQGGLSPQQTKGKELYAKDIGLVYYKKTYNKDFELEYELGDIYTMDVFEAKLKAKQ